MAIDSTLFSGNITAAAHTVGEVVNLGPIAGPANVRSGRGAAILKSIQVGSVVGSASTNSLWKVYVKNSDWIDAVASNCAAIEAANPSVLSPDAGCYQSGHDCQLTPNSGWQVYAVCVRAGTETTSFDVFALIDVDYPSVAAVSNPRTIAGFPTSIDVSMPVYLNGFGTLGTATWNTVSVDYFKAGFKYCLDKVELSPSSGAGIQGFVAFSNAAGMGGLQRIIPINTGIAALKYPIRYASTLVKGPMDIKALLFTGTAGAATIAMVHDYVKKQE